MTKKPAIFKRELASKKPVTTEDLRFKKAGFKQELRLYELEVLQGLVAFAENEVSQLSGVTIVSKTDTSICFSYGGNTAALGKLKRVIAVYRLSRFAIPRPKALLGNQQFGQLLSAIASVRQAEAFKSFRFEAAGKDSKVFQRLAEALAKELGLAFDSEAGELMLRVRPYTQGWEVLIRLTPRPLSARTWRVCNMPGGLNASLAVVMNDLAGLKAGETYLNAMCGSGTLLIEQALVSQARAFTALDIRAEALACTRSNIIAAGLKQSVELIEADSCQHSFAQGFEVITADLPWGDAVGSHRANALLYPAFLENMARAAKANARLVVLTHEMRLFEELIKTQTTWTMSASYQVSHGGHYPRIYVLKKVRS